jgi:hypothetical protein
MTLSAMGMWMPGSSFRFMAVLAGFLAADAPV